MNVKRIMAAAVVMAISLLLASNASATPRKMTRGGVLLVNLEARRIIERNGRRSTPPVKRLVLTNKSAGPAGYNGCWVQYQTLLRWEGPHRDRAGRLWWQAILTRVSPWRWYDRGTGRIVDRPIRRTPPRPKPKPNSVALPAGMTHWRTSDGRKMWLKRDPVYIAGRGSYVEGDLGGGNLKGWVNGRVFKGRWSTLYDGGNLELVFTGSNRLIGYFCDKNWRRRKSFSAWRTR